MSTPKPPTNHREATATDDTMAKAGGYKIPQQEAKKPRTLRKLT